MPWSRIRGHDHQIEAFARAIQRGRLAHAYLFAGPEGVGKRLFAGELAKALLCETNDPAVKLEACGECAACALVDAGTHPDFFAIGRPEEGNEIPIEVLRELCGSFALKPARGRGKIAIVDDADDLNDASANCFLKTLEEPPPRSVFILVGTSSERQLATVVSRCQVVRFAPLPESLLRELLGGLLLASEEGKKGGTPLVPRLVRLANGSLGQAMALADPALWDFRRVLLEGLAKARPDTVGLARQWTEFAEDAGKETAAQRRRAALVLRLLMQFLNDALAVSLGGTPKLAEPDDLRLLEALNRRVKPDTLLQMLDRCLEAEFHLDRYVQLVLALEGLLDSLGQLIDPPVLTNVGHS